METLKKLFGVLHLVAGMLFCAGFLVFSIYVLSMKIGPHFAFGFGVWYRTESDIPGTVAGISLIMVELGSLALLVKARPFYGFGTKELLRSTIRAMLAVLTMAVGLLICIGLLYCPPWFSFIVACAAATVSVHLGTLIKLLWNAD